jgi:hypothetical protein
VPEADVVETSRSVPRAGLFDGGREAGLVDPVRETDATPGARNKALTYTDEWRI